ncbi:MAG: acetyl-CoA synthetase, partial [Micromonosporaceae bacterium]|nr:acetyl-CoA synthetase [Micromonosporaceae bacterium]
SATPGALGRLPIEYLQRYGYPGRILPVNPKGGEILGLPAHPSVTAAPGPVDLALIMVAADKTPAAIDDCAAANVPVAIIGASGFAEAGDAGQALQDQIAAKARTGKIRLLGPNCIGAAAFHTGLVASFSPMFGGASTRLVPGRVGFVSQSGALGYGAVSLAFERGLGLGWAVTTGNEADITALEAMRALAEEPACDALLGYLESLTDVAQLRDLAAAGKPVALLKAGRSEAGAAAAASHTGALATEDRVIEATLRQLGIARAADVDELLDIGDAFASPRRPAGPRIAVVTTSGGSGILAADAVADHGLVLSGLTEITRDALREIVPAYGSIGNPVDVTAAVMRDPTLVERSLRVVADDAQVDMLVACFCVLTSDDVAPIVDALARVAAATGKPVLVARTGAAHLAPEAGEVLRAAGIPTYTTPARAIRAAAALWQVSRPRAASPARGDQGMVEATRRPDPQPSLDHRTRPVTEAELKALLAGVGVPVPRGAVVSTPAAAGAAVREFGGLAVMKALGVLHKTEAGGVALGVTAESAAEVFARLARVYDGSVLVEEQVTGGVELLVGIAPSPLGPVLTLGAGGVLTEVLDDVAVRLLPVTELDIRELLSETKVARLLAGRRGAEPADIAALSEVVTRLQDLVAGWAPGYELDLNPVVVLPRGAVVLDAAYVAPKEI